MYYKIENKESEVYKKLHEMRTAEWQMEEENKAAVNEKIGLEWESYLGYAGQQTWNRVTSYLGFKFKEPEKVDPKLWNEHKEHKGVHIPNRRTKAGREIDDLLKNGLKGHAFNIVFEILGVEYRKRFQFPVVEICNQTIVLFLGEDYGIDSDDIIEITKREFEELYTTENIKVAKA